MRCLRGSALASSPSSPLSAALAGSAGLAALFAPSSICLAWAAGGFGSRRFARLSDICALAGVPHARRPSGIVHLDAPDRVRKRPRALDASTVLQFCTSLRSMEKVSVAAPIVLSGLAINGLPRRVAIVPASPFPATVSLARSLPPCEDSRCHRSPRKSSSGEDHFDQRLSASLLDLVPEVSRSELSDSPASSGACVTWRAPMSLYQNSLVESCSQD